MISVELLTKKQFNAQSRTLIEDFQNQTKNSFRQNLALIIDVTLGNQYMPVYETNWHFIAPIEDNLSILTESHSYSENCSCASSQSMKCREPLILNDNLSINGMFIGCLPITSLRLSTLECFHDRICFDKVNLALNTKNSSSIELLNHLSESHFRINTTLDKIIDELMLEEWIYSIDYNQYLEKCHVTQCTYSVTERNRFVIIFTTLLSLCKY